MVRELRGEFKQKNQLVLCEKEGQEDENQGPTEKGQFSWNDEVETS